MSTVAERLSRVRAAIEAATERRGPGPGVTLIGVSKRQSVDAIVAAAEAGLEDFGENYAQELRDKQHGLALSEMGAAMRWHFIGALQSNKVKMVLGAHLLHTVDRASLVDAIDKRAAATKRVQDVLVQVNVSGETSKSGTSPDELLALLHHFEGRDHVRCRGLMTIPPAGPPESSRPHFRALRKLRDDVRHEVPANVELEELSMGMSADFAQAIEEGATLVRIGTAIFGARAG